MSKKNYVIVGITDQLAKKWSKDFREDLNLYRDDKGEILAEIKLTFIEAIVMKAQMKKYNRTYLCNLELKRVKSKIYRV